MKNILIITMLMFIGCNDESSTVQSSIVHGCLDSQACNYNSSATIDNNSCEYEVDECGECGGDNSTCIICEDISLMGMWEFDYYQTFSNPNCTTYNNSSTSAASFYPNQYLYFISNSNSIIYSTLYSHTYEEFIEEYALCEYDCYNLQYNSINQSNSFSDCILQLDSSEFPFIVYYENNERIMKYWDIDEYSCTEINLKQSSYSIPSFHLDNNSCIDPDVCECLGSYCNLSFPGSKKNNIVNPKIW